MNVPNALTLLRIAAVPVVVWLLLGEGDTVRWWAWGVFVVAMITDALDGYIARRFNLITAFGKLADPIADKFMVGGTLITLSVLGEVSWVITVGILLREVGITVWRMVVASQQVVAAAWQGKAKTVVQTLGLLVALTPWAMHGGVWHTVGLLLLWVALVLTWTSAWGYIKQAFSMASSGAK